MGTDRFRRLARPALAAVLALTGAGLSACSGTDEDNPLAPHLEAEAVPDLRGPEDPDDPYQGLLDAAFREDLEAYAREEVTVLADVAEVVSPRVFTISAPDGSEVDPVLVVTTAAAGDVDPQEGQSLVLAAVPVRDLQAAVVVDELDLDIDEGQLEDWDGDTFLVATIVEPAP